MSLEQAVNDNTLAIRELIAAMTARGATNTEVGTAVHKVVEEALLTETPGQHSGRIPSGPNETPGQHSGRIPSGPPITKKPAAATASSPSGATPAATPKAAAPAANTASETYDQESDPAYIAVKKAILELSTKQGRDTAVAVLQRFGAAKVPALKREQYADAEKMALDALAGVLNPEDALA